MLIGNRKQGEDGTARKATTEELRAFFPWASEDFFAANEGSSPEKPDNSQAPVMPVTEQPTQPDGAKGKPRQNQAKRSRGAKNHPHQDFLDQIVDLAHLTGWKVAYFRAARVTRNGRDTYETPVGADGKDFPDLILARYRGILELRFWEAKIPPDKARPGQLAWLALLHGRVVTPADWDWIVEELR